MCEILNAYCESKIVDGYKIAIKSEDGKYYSPYTGYEYNVGKIDPPKDFYLLSDITDSRCEVLNNKTVEIFKTKFKYAALSHGIKYNIAMHGKTGVITSRSCASGILQCFIKEMKKETENEINFVALKMSITGDLFNAKYNGTDIVIGNEIVSFEEIKLHYYD